MHVSSTRLGKLEVSDNELIQLPDGLPGFPAERSFALLPYHPGSPFFFLQSLRDPDLLFCVVEAFTFFPSYEFALDDELTHRFGIDEENLPHVYAIVTIPEKLEDMTANLLAPVVVNSKTRVGVQYVLEKTSYTTRHRLFPAVDQAKGGK